MNFIFISIKEYNVLLLSMYLCVYVYVYINK